jgi:hypothetical protein
LKRKAQHHHQGDNGEGLCIAACTAPIRIEQDKRRILTAELVTEMVRDGDRAEAK